MRFILLFMIHWRQYNLYVFYDSKCEMCCIETIKILDFTQCIWFLRCCMRPMCYWNMCTYDTWNTQYYIVLSCGTLLKHDHLTKFISGLPNIWLFNYSANFYQWLKLTWWESEAAPGPIHEICKIFALNNNNNNNNWELNDDLNVYVFLLLMLIHWNT